MLHKEKIVVLHTIKHSDKGIVVNGYSNTKGRCAYYFYASKKNHNMALLTPLSLLDGIVFQRHSIGVGSGLPILKEIDVSHNLHNIKSDIKKNCIAIFMCELINKTIKEESPNENLFDFITNSVLVLNSAEKGIENFHLYFCATICKILGYMPNDNYSKDKNYFDFTIGQFSDKYNESTCFPPLYSTLLHTILTTPITEISKIECSGKNRSEFLEFLIKYLGFHLGMELNIKSLPILSEILN